MKVKTLGIDLAKETFGLHGVDALGRVVVHKRVTRKQLRGFARSSSSATRLS